ncbi:MAG: NADH-quinone oxidoreductase subunit H [Arcobacteraceae bacterium]|nr:NADH-quinone oxidoreductase subunit H [Arcobacteraceae bacterium]
MIEYLLIALTPLFGGLIYGVQRVVKARMQNRVGPPILQPFYDMFKLLDKEVMIINNYHIIFAIMHLLTLWIVVAFVILGKSLLYVIFLHLLSSIFVVLAGYSVKSIYSHMGSNRELLSIVAYEPILILVAVGFYMVNGSFDIETIRSNPSTIASMIALFVAFLLTMPIKLKLSPFDATEAHQEIVGGVEVEYSGVFFEILYMAKWIEYVFIYLLLILFAGDNYFIAFGLFAIVFLALNLVDNATARVRIDSLVKIVLGFGLFLSIVNLIGLHYV